MNNPEFEKQVNQRLRAAVKSVSTPPHLEGRILANVRSTPQRSGWAGRFVAVAAAVIICVAATFAYQRGYMRFTANSRESYVSSVSNQVAAIMRVGLRDHIHCAVFRKYPKNTPKLEDLAKDMGPQYAGLLQIAATRVPNGYQLMMAHQCQYHGRKFVHVVYTNRERILSFIVAVKGEGESFQTENLVPALSEAGIPIYRNEVQRFQIAAFETRDHLIYAISDLPQHTNTEMLLAFAPSFKQFLSTLEI